MTKLLIGLLGVGVLATGGWAAASSLESDPARTVSLPGATTTGATTTEGATTTGGATTARTTAEDISGPCDEAEHRNDPRCNGVIVPAPVPTSAGTTTGDDSADAGDDDRRGGDDDHGDDDGDDHSGPGRGGGDDDDEDRSGSNSGKG